MFRVKGVLPRQRQWEVSRGVTCPQIEGARSSHPRNVCPKNIVPRQRHEEMPHDRGVVRGHTPTIGTDRVEADRASLASSCPLPRHATFWLCVPGVRASSTFDSRARHPRLTSHCRCRGSVLRAHLESLMTLKLVRMLPVGEGSQRARSAQVHRFWKAGKELEVFVPASARTRARFASPRSNFVRSP